MDHYESGDIVLLVYPFSDRTETKQRPALVLVDTGDNDIIVARITGQNLQTPFDIKLEEWQKAGLRIPSIVRLHKVATLEKHLVKSRLGVLTNKDWKQVQTTVSQLWQKMRR